MEGTLMREREAKGKVEEEMEEKKGKKSRDGKVFKDSSLKL